jgi:hypothetical protein
MRFGELLSRVRGVNAQAAVVEELISYLKKAEDGEFQIPMEGDTENVPVEHITVIREKLEEKRDKYYGLLEKLDEAEVGDVDIEDPGI